MREDYLHFLWEFQKWRSLDLKTSEEIPIKVLSPGSHNLLSGPDFFNARLVIGAQEWAGNVEIHLKSSDWYVHRHEKDPAYDNVVLHVVWEHDLEVFRKDNSALPVLELKNRVSEKALKAYQNLSGEYPAAWINCEKSFASVDDFTLNNWLERVYIERLEKKSDLIFEMLSKSSGNWEEVLFRLLAKNLGLNVNGEAFLGIAQAVPFSSLRKCRNTRMDLEALLMGQAGLLEKDHEEPYFKELKKTYLFQKRKFGLEQATTVPVKYFRSRPDNFPEIRLAQLAAIYHAHASLFLQLIKIQEMQEVRKLFDVEVSEFWNTHYSFSKSHSFRRKRITENVIDLLIINTLVPLKFCYLKKTGKDDFDSLFNMMISLKAETNQVIQKFTSLKPSTAKNAMETQALLELKKEYCEHKKCLNCAVGLKILQREEQI